MKTPNQTSPTLVADAVALEDDALDAVVGGLMINRGRLRRVRALAFNMRARPANVLGMERCCEDDDE